MGLSAWNCGEDENRFLQPGRKQSISTVYSLNAGPIPSPCTVQSI